jgi:hypothetical protein
VRPGRPQGEEERVGIDQVEARARAAGGEPDRLRAVGELEPLSGRRRARVDELTRLARRVFGVTSAAVTLVDEDTQHVLASAGIAVQDVPREVSFCARTVGVGTHVVEDAAADAGYAGNPLVTGEPHVRFYAGRALEAPGGQRLGALCLVDEHPRTFSATDEALLDEMAAWVQDELTRSAELEHAAAVQRSLLPSRPPRLPGWDVAGFCQPSGSVGGDLLDWYRTPDGGLAVTLGDVMGKGLPAAILMATVRGVMRLAGRQAAPAEAVRQAAETLHEDLESSGTLVTLCHAALGADGGLRFCDAGHGLMVLVRADGSVHRPPPGGLPLGVVPGERWAETELTVQPGDTVLAFSDGLLDLHGGSLDALDDVVAAASGAGSAAEVVERFRRRVREAGDLPDDVTVVAIRRG